MSLTTLSFRPDFMEPDPVILVPNIETSVNTSTVCVGLSNFHNIQYISYKIFNQLTIDNVSFQFNSTMASWSCSYFPTDYITPVEFVVCLRQDNDRLLVEYMYLSGYYDTFIELINNICNDVRYDVSRMQ